MVGKQIFYSQTAQNGKQNAFYTVKKFHFCFFLEPKDTFAIAGFLEYF